MVKENMLKDKSFKFAIRIVKLYKYLCDEKKEFVLSKQVLCSGTSVGALVREAEHGESKADFVHKLAIAQKEINETIYWLELMCETIYISTQRIGKPSSGCHRNTQNDHSLHQNRQINH
ncbi:MAG TPA: four helix bundle protein [Prolixibacteraceae bacterium]|jgi:four helix bundle protein